MTWLSRLGDEAAGREAAGLRRELRPRGAGDAVVDLAGNDYLGLATNPTVIAAAAEALSGYGLGATGSRLVRGTTTLHDTLETELAAWLGSGSALVYSSGYLANLGAVRAAARPGTLVISDAHNHASLVDGCRLARERTVVVPHSDVAAIQAQLAGHDGPALVVTESVYSVDGDLAPLREIHAVVRAAGAVLLVDEAHAVGVLGPRGAGAVAAYGLAGEPDVIVTATLSKSFGAAGGIVAGPPELRRHLVDTGRTFIYDTALPPPVAAGALAALALVGAADDLRALLRDRALRTVDRLRAAGLEVSRPDAAVISVIAPSPEAALDWALACRDGGVAVGCFRPPSTPDGTSRLRLTLNAGVPADRYDDALDVIVKTRP